MDRELRILILEDSPADAELLQRQLHKGGVSFVARTVDAREPFVAQLQEFQPDLVISDYTLPSFDGLAALKLVRQRSPELPFIFVSGSIGEERATQALRMGATDYVLKDRPRRLVPAVQRAIQEVEQRAERRRLEEKYRGIFENAVVGIYQTTVDGRYLTANPILARMFGYDSPEELVASLPDLKRQFYVEPSRRTEFVRLVQERGWVSGFESQIYRRDGSVMWISEEARAVRDAEGRLVGFEGTTMDITERKHAQEAGERLIAVLEATPDFVGIADSDGRAIYLNRGGRTLIGLAEDEDMAGFHIMNSHPEWARKIVTEEAMPVALRDGVWTGETGLLHRDGREIPVWQTILAHKSPGDAVMFLSTIARDLSHQRQLEQQFRQAQKMEAVGRLAGGVAHDFNNLLTVIMGECDMTLADLSQDSTLRDPLEEIRQAAERAAVLTRQLLTFSRKQLVEPAVFSFNDVVGDMNKMLARLIGEDITLRARLADDLGSMKADRGQVEQVLANLVVNARDAMPEGGTLIVETANVALGEEYARTHEGLSVGQYVMLSVSDTGSGMSEDVQAHLFEPFFTTKERGKGTGLGLATCYAIIQQFGGHIGVYSQVGVGTTMKVYLPRTSESGAVSRTGTQRTSTGGKETILLVEDEAGVREVAHRVLTAKGYTVLVAADGEEALRRLEQYAGTVHLLLTDVVLPKLGGRKLAEQVGAVRPNVNVLFMSGYTDDVILQNQLLQQDVNLLHKPFTPESLARTVREVLDRSST